MRHLSHWNRFINESESEGPTSGPTMIPFIVYMGNYYSALQVNKINSYWIMGSFPTFQDFGLKVLDLTSIKIDPENDVKKITTLPKLKELIDTQSFAQRSLIFWSDGLELVNPKKSGYSIASGTDPYWTTNRLGTYFTNAELILRNNGEGDKPDSLVYLARSLENKPDLLSDYTKEELEQILPLTSWNEREKKVFLGMSKTKGMI
jgi:hypothetical protein